jgi:hypothetical protein
MHVRKSGIGGNTVLRNSVKFGLAALALLIGLQANAAQAAIASPALVAAAAQQAPDITAVRWVCGPLRCVWRPGFRGPAHPWAAGWGAPRHANCVWERTRGGPWVEICR